MTTVFDGMAGALNAVFGAPVTIFPGGGAGVAIQGVIRDQEIQVADREGESSVWVVETILRAQRDVVTAMVRGDVVETGAGDRYAVRYRMPVSSPAADRFERFVLDKI